MKSLADAWAWYTTTRATLLTHERVGQKLWRDERVCEIVGRDNRLRSVTQGDVIRGATDALAPLDDLAVLVLFSVFEATLRHELIAQLQGEVAKLDHPVVRQAVSDAADGIENGSFYNRVLSVLKRPHRP